MLRDSPYIPLLLAITLSLSGMSWSTTPAIAASGDIIPENRERFLRFDGDPATATDEEIIEALSGVRVTSIRYNYNVVRAVQTRLVQLGYDPKGVDGSWGQNTMRALNAYRADAGIPRRNFLDWNPPHRKARTRPGA
jgi:hypothetical protein